MMLEKCHQVRVAALCGIGTRWYTHNKGGERYCEVIALYCYCDGGTLTENIREILSCCLGWIGGHSRAH